MYLNYNYYTINYKNAMKLYASWIRSIFISAILRLGHFYPISAPISAPQKIVVICIWQPIHVIKSLSINRSLQEGLLSMYYQKDL